MAKRPKVTADDLLARVTGEMIAAIEAGAGKWKMPWQRIGDTNLPRSIDGRWYRGINVPILMFEALDKGYDTGLWGTYEAWQKHGGQIRKGEEAAKIIWWSRYVKKGKDGEADTDENGKPRMGMSMRVFSVFNAAQQDGWTPKKPPVERNTPERLAHAEEFFAAIGAEVRYGGNNAFYDKLNDRIQVPKLDQFDIAAHFYSTLGHEHVHWTGHKDRLDREMGKRFGDDAYGAEELVAELGAALLSAKLGIDLANRTDHAAYLASWLRVLKADARSLLTVMSKAQAAVDFMEEAAGRSEAPDDGADDIIVEIDDAGQAVLA